MWKANKEVYESHTSDLELAYFSNDGYQGISERIADMEKSDTYAGEPEIPALVHVVKRPIAVAQIKALFLEKLTESLLTRFICSPTQKGEETLQDIMIFCEGEEDKPTELPKVGSYVIISKGKTVWYPGLVMNADNDGNEI